MDRLNRAGGGAFTLVELLVVIAIIGTLMGLLLPAVQNAREASRSNACRSNLANLQKAMTSYESSNKLFPGYVEEAGSLKKIKASWGAMMLPYIERGDLWDNLTRGKPYVATIEIFVCPSNEPEFDGAPAMSYLANAGHAGRESNDDITLKENIANGVFFDRVRALETDDKSTMDIRDIDPCPEPKWCPDAIFKMTFGYVQGEGDGSTNTLMFAEGLNAVHWTQVGASRPDKKWHYGFIWDTPTAIADATANSPSSPLQETDPQFGLINGVREEFGYPDVGSKDRNSGFPSSYHPGGVNVAFVGGQVQFLSERITPLVYAQLMTSNRKRSDLKERDIPMPDAEDF